MPWTLEPGAAALQALIAKGKGQHNLSSDGGVLLLREVDRAHRMCGELAGCSSDHRNRDFVEHDLALMLRQRIPGIAQGYEDLDDHERLRQGVKAIPRRSRAALPHD